MATVEQPTRSDEIRVENPATGEFVASVPRIAPADVAALVARARAAQPAWEALEFDGRGEILRRAQKWVVENSDRIARTIVSETGKTYDDALIAEIGYVASAFGFWAKHAALPRRREGAGVEPVPVRPAARGALPPARGDRRDRPVELPADELVRRLHPGARGRQRRGPQAVAVDAADIAADGRGAARERPARGRL